MSRLLYVTTVPFDFESLDGVQKKILNQLRCFAEYYDVDLLCRTSQEVVIVSIPTMKRKIISGEVSRKGLLMRARLALENKQYELLYIRFPKSDPYLMNLFKTAKNNGIKAVMELPTYPYDSEGLESVSGKIKALVDKHYRLKLKKYLDRIITYSNDNEIFGIKTIKTINGIDFSKIDINNNVLNNEVHLIAVSSMYRVHGYERIIEGLNTYYNSESDKKKVVLDLVGDGDYIALYKELVEKYKLDKYVIFHGKVFNEELRELYHHADIGLNSLAIHRQGLTNESTLKTKEYAAYGLPIVSSSYVDAFNENDNHKYVLRVEPDESDVNIQEIINFYDNICNDKKRSDLGLEIRNAARNVCDMGITLIPIIEYFEAESK